MFAAPQGPRTDGSEVPRMPSYDLTAVPLVHTEEIVSLVRGGDR